MYLLITYEILKYKPVLLANQGELYTLWQFYLSGEFIGIYKIIRWNAFVNYVVMQFSDL